MGHVIIPASPLLPTTPNPSILEGVTHRHYIFGLGLYVSALQAYTTGIVPESAIEVVFESKHLLYYTFVQLQNVLDLILIPCDSSSACVSQGLYWKVCVGCRDMV